MLYQNQYVTAEESPTGLILHIRGEIDHHIAPAIRTEADRMILYTGKKTVILDLSAVEFMDSSGLGLLMGRKALTDKLGKDLLVRNPAARIFKILDLAGLTKILNIEYKNGGKNHAESMQK